MAGRHFKDPEARHFEDFQIGDVIESRGRTVEYSDIITFAGLTGDHYPLHMDAEFAAQTRFNARLVHGPLTFAFAVGLMGLTNYYGDGIVALKEIKSLRALKPVFANDTLRVVAEVVVLDGENQKYGTIEVLYTVKNQRGESVMTFNQAMLARKKSAEG